MGRRRVSGLALWWLLCAASSAAAQPSFFSGFLTAHVGASRGGDVGDAATTGGVSMAVIDRSGLGAEVDVAHTGPFDEQFFGDGSSITSAMVNFAGQYPDGVFRPFVNAGVGVLRLHTAQLGAPAESRTKFAWNAGGGVLVMVNDWLGFRGDVRYFRLFDNPESVALRDSGFFDYWRPTIGATFSWPLR